MDQIKVAVAAEVVASPAVEVTDLVPVQDHAVHMEVEDQENQTHLVILDHRNHAAIHAVIVDQILINFQMYTLFFFSNKNFNNL